VRGGRGAIRADGMDGFDPNSNITISRKTEAKAMEDKNEK